MQQREGFWQGRSLCYDGVMAKQKQSSQPSIDKQLSSLDKQLETLNRRISRQVDLRWVFARGMVGGLATVLGATLLAGIIIALIMQTLDSVNQIPFLQDLIDPELVEMPWENGGR